MSDPVSAPQPSSDGAQPQDQDRPSAPYPTEPPQSPSPSADPPAEPPRSPELPQTVSPLATPPPTTAQPAGAAAPTTAQPVGTAGTPQAPPPGTAQRTGTPLTTPAQDATMLERTLFEVKKIIVGQDRMIERMLVAVLARGHCLLEGVPGVAKTLAVETLARVVGGSFARVQFTPDLVPADIVGTRIYRSSSERFDVELGPVFVNFLLADEINRAPAKVQSALLEVMAEHQVSIGGHTYDVPTPFLVMATQNPIEQEGVYPLPEAQRDRFLFKIVVGYPTDIEEREIVYRVGVRAPEPAQILDPAALTRLQERADAVFVHNALVDYAVRLVFATREPVKYNVPDVAQLIQYGASPRASLGIVRAARALALMRGRDYALPQDLSDVAPDVLRHRLVLSYDALADDIPADRIVDRIMQSVPPPTVAPRQSATPGPALDVTVPPHSGPIAPLPAWPRN